MDESRIRKTTATIAVAATLMGGIGAQSAYAEDATAPATPDTGTQQPGDGTQTPAPTTWKATADGKTIDLTEDKDGTLTGALETAETTPGEITVTGYGEDGIALPDTAFTVTGAVTAAHAEDGDSLGTAVFKGTATYAASKTGTHPAVDVTAAYERKAGTPVGIDTGSDPIAFQKGEDGAWTASDSNYTLDEKNQPSGDTIRLSDGTETKIAWDSKTSIAEKDNGEAGKARFVRRNGTATGTVTVKDTGSDATLAQTWKAGVTADRAEDTSVTKLTITRTDAEGKTSTAYEGKFDASKTSLTIDPLPADQIGDAFTLSLGHGVDASIEEQGMTLGANASRVFRFTANGKAYTVTVPFKTADINDLKPDSPAKLTGIYVNRSGAAAQGDLIANWDPNRLDYVIQLGENDPNPYVLPMAGDGVTIQAGDRTQNAQGTRQEWKVTAKSGETRTYSVTTVRPVKTAVTEFKPNDPVSQTATVEPKDANDADLASHGWVDKTGAYHKTDDAKYTIPEGGTFSYETKIGQSAAVTSSRTGMTVTYTVTVLPKNTNAAPKRTVYTVTYLTEATSKAELAGIKVNGQDIGGFDKDRHEYEIPVVNPSQWTVSPVYDKTTGMSVTTHKDGRTAVITVTSGDGLTKTTYTVRVTQKMRVIDTVTTTLAATGAKGGIIGIAAVAVLAIIGAGVWLLTRRRHGKNAPHTARPDTPATGEDPIPAIPDEDGTGHADADLDGQAE